LYESRLSFFMKKTQFKKGKFNYEKLAKVFAKLDKVFRTIILIGLPILAVEFILLWTPNFTSSIKNAVALATTVKPEKFTELYFEDYSNLPKKIKLGEEQSFKFTIHNLENKDINYSYEVYIDVNGEKQIIGTNSIFIKNKEFKTIVEDFTLTPPTAKVEVIVNLINKDQQIDFWMGEQ